jgi:8-amino-7-oxononanoate synthase
LKEDFLSRRLSERQDEGSLRNLQSETRLVDFSSNDYLGFAGSEEFFMEVQKELSSLDTPRTKLFGSGGSRLLTGNSRYAEDLERFIAQYHHAESGLIFNSGYSANTGLISSVARKGDFILYDELSHASVYDGVRLSKADSFPFRHNDLHHLEERLKFLRSASEEKPAPSIFVIVESVYSMDGDFAPLIEIADLCEDYNANLIVDEAHATGIFGTKGEGKVVELELESSVFARVHTFGKALGCHGAIVLGSSELRNYLINFARPFIYTTALPLHALLAIKSAYNLLINSDDKILIINRIISLFTSKIKENKIHGFLTSLSPIQAMIIEGNINVKKVASLIQKDGYDVRPILSPTVPKGKERIRICLHAFNTEKEIDGLLVSLMKNAPTLPVSKLHAS